MVLSLGFQFFFSFRFERSDTYRIEVPRMLFEDQDRLEEYIAKLKDPLVAFRNL